MKEATEILNELKKQSPDLWEWAIDYAIKSIDIVENLPSVDDVFKMLSRSKSNFGNPNHYTISEQVNITVKDAKAIHRRIYEKV